VGCYTLHGTSNFAQPIYPLFISACADIYCMVSPLGRTEAKMISWSDPDAFIKTYKTRQGADVRILNILMDEILVGGRTVIAMYRARPDENEWCLNSWYSTGGFFPDDKNGKPRLDELDLVLVKE
jgi:hypothetical protein